MVLVGVFAVGLVGVLAEPVPDSIPGVPDTLDADVEADAVAAVDGSSGDNNNDGAAEVEEPTASDDAPLPAINPSTILKY